MLTSYKGLDAGKLWMHCSGNFQSTSHPGGGDRQRQTERREDAEEGNGGKERQRNEPEGKEGVEDKKEGWWGGCAGGS